MRTMKVWLPVVVLGTVVSANLAAQQAPRTLPAADATFEEPFSQVGVGGVRELRDGRVIVADPRDKVVSVVDFRSGSSSSIGREGSGPQEFAMPMRLYAAPSDTTFLFDPMNSRYLVIGPDAKPINTFRTDADAPPQRPAAGGNGGGPQLSFGGAGFNGRTTDGRGRIYGEGTGFSPGPNGPVSADSAPLVRFDRATRRLDTLAYLKLPKSNTQFSGSGGNQRMTIGVANPLLPRDEWTVFPDGRVAIVRANDYHVDWVMPDGTRRSSRPIAFTPVRMNAAEIRYEEGLRSIARANQMSMQISNVNGQVTRSAQMGPGANAPPLEPLTDWPDVKPPFRSGFPSVLARPNGDLWVRRTENAQARGTLYDVISAQGTVMYQVRIPDGLTLVGFGNNTIYTTRKDEDDLVYLQRHTVTEQALRGN